ncbi:hypothetical protein PO124_34200 [Bacillus licheniformis]|nr:hypothetical protein [Bacillus licheniformis]
MALTFKEIKAPDGYTISDAYADGVSVEINSSSSSAGALYKVVNEKNKVTLIKQDEQRIRWKEPCSSWRKIRRWRLYDNTYKY